MTAPLTDAERISDEQLDMIIADASGGYLTMLALRELKALREQCERQRKALDEIVMSDPWPSQLEQWCLWATDIAKKGLHLSASEKP